MTSFDPGKFANASGDGFDQSNPPDPGGYTVALTDARAFMSKKGNDIVLLDFKVVAGDLGPAWNGHEWTEVRTFKSEGAYNATKATCQRLGMDTENVVTLEEFESRLKALVGRWYKVGVEQRGEYRNVYVNEQVEAGQTAPAPTSDVTPAGAAAEFATQTAGPATDDIPF